MLRPCCPLFLKAVHSKNHDSISDLNFSTELLASITLHHLGMQELPSTYDHCRDSAVQLTAVSALI